MMAIEWIAIAALAAITGGLWLALLGMMREIVLLRSDVKVFRELVQQPPAPSFVGERAPAALTAVLADRPATARQERQLVAFLSPGCAPCEELADELAEAVKARRLAYEDVLVFAWAYSEEDAARYANRLPLETVVDHQGKLSRACEVRATPTLFIVSRDDHTVLDYTPEGRSEWILDRMRSTEPVGMPV